MAVRNVPPTDNYKGASTPARRQPQAHKGGFAALYEQARRNSVNDNPPAYDDDEQAPNERAQDIIENARDIRSANNLKYIETLHDSVDTLRGEILGRVIQSARSGKDAPRATGDISRLSARLDSLRKKLDEEETRLSGKLIDETI